jgi:hypothetical protein
MVAGLLVFFAANCIRLDVSLDTIPSVLGEYKPLQVVRCVKNKYLLSRLLFAGRAPQIAGFWCTAGRLKNSGAVLFVLRIRRANQVLMRPAAALALPERARSTRVCSRFSAALFDLIVGSSRRCFAGNLSQGS